MKQIRKTYAVDKDIIDAVLKARKGTGYKSEELLGYIVEYAYKRQHNIPFEVAIDGKPDGGYDFIRDGKKYDIKATFCPSEWMNPAGFTSWSLTQEKLHEDTTYILCRTNWREGMSYAYLEECYEVDVDELFVVGAEVHKGGTLYEYMSNRSNYVVHSNRDCLVCTNQFMDVYLQEMNKVTKYECAGRFSEGDCWQVDVNYTEFRERLLGHYNLSGVDKVSELVEDEKGDIFEGIRSLRNPMAYFLRERECYEEGIREEDGREAEEAAEYAESVAAGH